MWTDLTLVMVAMALVLMNAFFVAAEFGMVKLRQTRIETLKKTHGLRGRILSYIHQHLDAYLSACQLGITLASLGLGWVGEPAFANLLEPSLHQLGVISAEGIKLVSFFIAFSVISFLHIVLGELMPKSLALRQSEKISIWTALPLYGFYWIMYPAIGLLNACSNFLLKKMGLDHIPHGERFHSTEEIKIILHGSHIHGELTKDETEILEHALDLADLKVTDVMRPYEEMISLDLHQPVSELLKTVTEHRYSRYPVYATQRQPLIGILHVKDLLSALYQHGSIKDLQSLVRPVLKVKRQLPALDLLRKFREGMPHFAIVYQKTQAIGFVTLDNLLHVLIGRIKDEFHRTQDDWQLNQDGSFTVKGACPLFSLERGIDCDIDVEEDIKTLEELIFQRTGGRVQEGERLHLKEFTVIIEQMQNQRINKVKIITHPLSASSPE